MGKKKTVVFSMNSDESSSSKSDSIEPSDSDSIADYKKRERYGSKIHI